MAKRFLAILALLSLVLAGPAAVGAADVSVVAAFNPAAFELPEGLAVAPTGDLFVGMAPTGEIKRVTPAGAVSTFAQLPPPPQGQGFMTGMAFRGGQLYVALASFDPETHGIWRVGPNGGASRFAALDPAQAPLPNGLDFRGGTLYVAESGQGAIWAIDPAGTASLWKADPLLQGDPTQQLVIGANGIVFHGPNLYVTNTQRGRIVRVAVQPDGTPGAAEILLDNPALLMGADGITADEGGNLYVAVNAQDRLVAVGPDRDALVLAEGAPLQFPASPAISDGALYVTNFALPQATGAAPGQPMPSLARMPLTLPGATPGK